MTYKLSVGGEFIRAFQETHKKLKIKWFDYKFYCRASDWHKNRLRECENHLEFATEQQAKMWILLNSNIPKIADKLPYINPCDYDRVILKGKYTLKGLDKVLLSEILIISTEDP